MDVGNWAFCWGYICRGSLWFGLRVTKGLGICPKRQCFYLNSGMGPWHIFIHTEMKDIHQILIGWLKQKWGAFFLLYTQNGITTTKSLQAQKALIISSDWSHLGEFQSVSSSIGHRKWLKFAHNSLLKPNWRISYSISGVGTFNSFFGGGCRTFFAGASC